MNGKRAVRWGAVVSVVAVLAAVAGGSTASGASQDGYTLRIGVVVPFTGASAVFGPAYAKAAGLAVQQAKAALKKAGVDVTLQIEYADDGTTPEGGVNAAPTNFGEREVRDQYLFSFEAAFKEAKPMLVMPSYNELDGVPSHQNAWLLSTVLRGEWGFDGLVVSDYYAINELMDRHHTAGSIEERLVRARGLPFLSVEAAPLELHLRRRPETRPAV